MNYENIDWMLSDKQYNGNTSLEVYCGLSTVEFAERERLLELKRDTTRWFTQQEFDRLNELSNKMFANAGFPHIS